MYVFDTSPLSTLFKNYYRKRFPSLWRNFDALVSAGGLVSTREAYREITDGPSAELREWGANNQALFSVPNAASTAHTLPIGALNVSTTLVICSIIVQLVSHSIARPKRAGCVISLIDYWISTTQLNKKPNQIIHYATIKIMTKTLTVIIIIVSQQFIIIIYVSTFNYKLTNKIGAITEIITSKYNNNKNWSFTILYLLQSIMPVE